jgi:fused signal recognition particle receptor
MTRIGRNAQGIISAKDLKEALSLELRALIPDPPEERDTYGHRPHVIMVVGVNGVGKTTTIGKLAHRHQQGGKQVLIAAADTFRAAAVEQLEVWSQRAGAELIKHKANSDPAAVAFDGVQAAVARNSDLLIIDTAGRLHTKVNLMEELKKIQRTVAKRLPGAPHEVLLVLDATTGQNALSQAKLFNEAMGVTGLALTKLDGTAKGGIVVSICSEMQLPLEFVGVGEGVDDLQVFDPKAFVKALF